ncbi:MAG TPA: hypothetical protein VF200_11860 [Woeseiaceae bacterium]
MTLQHQVDGPPRDLETRIAERTFGKDRCENALWVVESLLAMTLGWLEPNALGRYLIIAQAIAVAAIAVLEFVGLRKARRLAL